MSQKIFLLNIVWQEALSFGHAMFFDFHLNLNASKLLGIRQEALSFGHAVFFDFHLNLNASKLLGIRLPLNISNLATKMFFYVFFMLWCCASNNCYILIQAILV